ncbi:hypothetical protein LTR97_003944 [Elasticomyces elasticus]|uniref:Rhodopsin domain-containing protein n=1 Tax=Elasticomyces elasticus TaxID=574655 RepID=A0AAN7W8N2_9PEZI|nr:hypothetical protein LTR97_003944 [Elasticomyces elasticus]
MSLGGGTYPPLVPHGPDDRGAIVVVVTYSLMLITILFAIMRTWTSHSHRRQLRWDDLAFFLAVLLLIAESILTGRAVNFGLGRHISNVAASRLVQYYRYQYAAQILGIIIQTLAKCAVVLMVERIASELSTKKLSLALKAVIGIWTVFSIFTIAFQCGVPRPWEFTHDKCAAHGKLYYVIIAGDMATDGILACYIIPTVVELQMSRYLKISVSSLFMTRLFVCALSLGYIALVPEYLSSNDKTWHNANVQILHQVVINFSVITAGIPSVRSYLSELQTGRLAMVLDESEIEMTTRGSKSRAVKKSKIKSEQSSSQLSGGQWSKRDHNSGSRGQPDASAPESAQDMRIRPDRKTSYTTHITGGAAKRHANETRDDVGIARVNDEEVAGDDESTSSLVKNGVFQRRDFEVRVEYEDQHGSIVRTSPNTLSYSSPTALHHIYGSNTANVRKSKFYEVLDGGSTTHTEIDKEKHSARRRVLSHAFSDAALRAAEEYVVSNVRKFVALLGPESSSLSGNISQNVAEKGATNWSPPRDMTEWCNWLAYDIMGDLVFGKSYHCLESKDFRWMPIVMTEGTKFGYWFAYLPFARLLQRFETSPVMQWLGGQTARDNATLVALAGAQLEERIALQEKRHQMKDEVGHKDLMHYLLTSADPKTGIRFTHAELEGDSLSLIGAGADTVAATLCGILFYLARNPTALRTVTTELRLAFQRLEEIRSGPRLDSCVYLNACIEETLRLAPVVPAQLPREVMKGGIVIDGQFVPEGIVVGVSAYVVHHDGEAFPEPWSFRPERWIEAGGGSKEDVSLAREAMCPFSLGKRGCIGKRLAYVEIRITIASLLWSYDLEEAKSAGQDGGGSSNLEEGRRRRDEFQLFDCFGSDRAGPVLRFRWRS